MRVVSQRSRPVIERRPTAMATRAPAANVWACVACVAMAAAAIAFMGWTGRGTPKTTPVRMLAKPVKTRVEGRLMDDCRARAIMSGRRVPRSPRAPDISAR